MNKSKSSVVKKLFCCLDLRSLFASILSSGDIGVVFRQPILYGVPFPK
jgi:hypothetical protein